MRLEDRQRYEQHEVVAIVVCPKYLPKPKDIIEWELALECDENPTRITSAREELDTRLDRTGSRRRGSTRPFSLS